MLAATAIPSFVVYLILAVVAGIALVILSAILGMLVSFLGWAANWLRPRHASEARVVGKRADVWGSAPHRMRTEYFATFELPDGRRREFSLPGRSFGLIVEGDRGTLTWQGTALRGFRRAAAVEKIPLDF